MLPVIEAWNTMAVEFNNYNISRSSGGKLWRFEMVAKAQILTQADDAPKHIHERRKET
ncbi:MAG: hypothetical protein JSW12_02325 [Deltaproteobacteria bacterium]|nr:MAG: hypothetical protein JSW12_02325 [Deltaproteobacteria bacterium]